MNLNFKLITKKIDYSEKKYSYKDKVDLVEEQIKIIAIITVIS